jgi:hypothetical protein
LADTLVDEAFAVKEIDTFAVDPAGFYQRMYLLFYKVLRLKPQDKERVVAYWQGLLKDRAPHGPWTIYEHMQADRYDSQSFMSEIQTAIGQRKTTGTRWISYGGIAPGAAAAVDSQYTYGIAVAQWLSSHRSYGFLTGTTPGTPVLLPDGTTKPVESIAEGEQVFGRNGNVFQRSSQSVTWDLAQPELLYGINDYEPFFTASHPFLTEEGWKAISPTVAQRVNPGLDIGELTVGDRLLQVASTDPFEYRSVEVKQITERANAPEAKVHSLHLRRDNPGYHAHGFCVAVNYPEFTEDTFADGFARLTPAERLMIANRLLPVLPLLNAALGNYVEQALTRTLTAAEPAA